MTAVRERSKTASRGTSFGPTALALLTASAGHARSVLLATHHIARTALGSATLSGVCRGELTAAWSARSRVSASRLRNGQRAISRAERAAELQ